MKSNEKFQHSQLNSKSYPLRKYWRTNSNCRNASPLKRILHDIEKYGNKHLIKCTKIFLVFDGMILCVDALGEVHTHTRNQNRTQTNPPTDKKARTLYVWCFTVFCFPTMMPPPLIMKKNNNNGCFLVFSFTAEALTLHGPILTLQDFSNLYLINLKKLS